MFTSKKWVMCLRYIHGHKKVKIVVGGALELIPLTKYSPTFIFEEAIRV